MTLTSLYFLIFLAAVTLIYYLVPKKIQWIWLLAASLGFYAISAKGFIVVLVLYAVIVYGFAGLFEKKKNKGLVVLELVLVFGLVVLLKNFFWFGATFEKALIKVSLTGTEGFVTALGVSYIALMGCGYSIDVYRGTIRAEKNFWKILAFLAFFPSIVQGPINRFKDLNEQFGVPHRFCYESLTKGIQRILWGFFKVLVLGERFGVIKATLTSGWGDSAYTGWYIVLAVVTSSFNLFMNFSGAMDIVIGASQILGIRIPENFDHPYLAKSMPEFWRKWHITLGAWLRDYVMYSFTMSKPAKKFNRFLKEKINRKFAAAMINIFGVILVWLIFGLWHGIAWNFLLAGAYYGLLIILGIALEGPIKRFNNRFPELTSSKGFNVFRIVRTIFLSIQGSYLMTLPNVKVGLAYLSGIFSLPTGKLIEAKGSLLSEIKILGLDVYDFIILILGFALWIVVSRLQEKKDVRERLEGMNIVGRWAILLGMILAVVLFGFYGKGFDAGTFIYQGF